MSATVPVEHVFGMATPFGNARRRRVGWQGRDVPPGQFRASAASPNPVESGGGVVNAIPTAAGAPPPMGAPAPPPMPTVSSGGGGIMSKIQNLFKDKKTLAIAAIGLLVLIFVVYFFFIKKKGRKNKRR